MRIKKLLEKAISYNASDLHISPNLPPMYRINGHLTARNELDILTPGETEEMLSALKKQALNATPAPELEVDFTYENELGRFRVNIFPQLQGLAATFRIISNTLLSLDRFGLSNQLVKCLDANEGLLLVTGKACTGKSTTLAAMIEHINIKHQKHIITLEDPIEYVHKSKQCLITQREIYSHTTSLNSALRASLRENPDVIVIGEIRDSDTMQLALRAAETGHLVIATLHTHSTTHCIQRILDFFKVDERNQIQQQLADILLAILCQQLMSINHANRVALFECLLSNSAIKHLIRENKIAHIKNVLQTSEQAGMFTFEQFQARYHLTQHVLSDLAPLANTWQAQQIK